MCEYMPDGFTYQDNLVHVTYYCSPQLKGTPANKTDDRRETIQMENSVECGIYPQAAIRHKYWLLLVMTYIFPNNQSEKPGIEFKDFNSEPDQNNVLCTTF